MNIFNKHSIATAIAILFHAVGLSGILFFKSELIVSTTSLHLLLMAALLFYTQQKITANFILLFLLCFAGGMLAEYVGISTGLLFGNYHYGKVLGPAIGGVPVIIGLNWFIIIYCCGVAMHSLLQHLSARISPQAASPSPFVKMLSVVIDGATLAVFMDWLIEPVAIKLGYWQWIGNGEVPLFNYISWFVVSVLLMLAFQLLSFPKQNKFAIHLLLIQAMFFLLLRTFL